MVFLLIKRCKGTDKWAKNQRKTSFICFCSHLFVPLASPKLLTLGKTQIIIWFFPRLFVILQKNSLQTIY